MKNSYRREILKYMVSVAQIFDGVNFLFPPKMLRSAAVAHMRKTMLIEFIYFIRKTMHDLRCNTKY